MVSTQTVERGAGRRVRVASLPLRRTKVTEIDISEMEANDGVGVIQTEPDLEQSKLSLWIRRRGQVR